MADTDEFDKGTLRNSTRGIAGIGTVNERDAVGAAKDAISEGKRLVAEQRIGEKVQNAEAFVGEKVEGAKEQYTDWKADQAVKAAADRERRRAEAQEKMADYRDTLETKRAEAEVKVLEAQARSFEPQGGDKVAQLRDAMQNMKAEGQKLFSGPVSNAMRNAPNPLEGGYTAPPLMNQLLMPTARQPRSYARRGPPPPISPLMRDTAPGAAPVSPLMRNAPRVRLPTLLQQAGGVSRRKGSTLGGSLMGSVFGKPGRKRRRRYK
jgi:hypothetical protein